jgi:hypothetical protein
VIHVWLLTMYFHGVPDVVSVHASLSGCEQRQRAAESSGSGLLYRCQMVSVAP